MATHYGVSILEIGTVGVQKKKCQTLSWRIRESILCTQLKYIEDAYTSPSSGKEKSSLIFCMLLCGLSFLKILIVH